MRIVVVGGPRTGKTTYATKLAKQLGVHLASTGKRTEAESGLVSTDNYMKKANWAETPNLIIKDLRGKKSFVLEGTQAARVLRRWYKQDPDEPKIDKVLVFGKAWVNRNPGQVSMAKGVQTVLADLAPILARAGVEMEQMTPAEMTPEEWRSYFQDTMAHADDPKPETEVLAESAEVVQDIPQESGL